MEPSVIQPLDPKYPTFKAQLVARDFNHIKETCKVSDDVAANLLRLVHLAVAIGSVADEYPRTQDAQTVKALLDAAAGGPGHEPSEVGHQ